MPFPDYFDTLVKMIPGVSIPITILFIVLCCVTQQEGVYVTYYINLLICDVIQHVTLIATMANIGRHGNHELSDSMGFRIFGWGVMASLCFRLMIALERYFFISCPQLLCIKKQKGLEMVFVLVWVICFVFVPLVIAFQQKYSSRVCLFFLTPVFIICLAGTLKSLPAATSVPIAEKQRTVAILVVLLINNISAVLPTIEYSIYTHFNASEVEESTFILFFLSPCMDLILFIFICKRIIDKLPMCFCCCWIEEAAGNESNESPV